MGLPSNGIIREGRAKPPLAYCGAAFVMLGWQWARQQEFIVNTYISYDNFESTEFADQPE